jgi:Flp pilus assembly protein TadB
VSEEQANINPLRFNTGGGLPGLLLVFLVALGVASLCGPITFIVLLGLILAPALALVWIVNRRRSRGKERPSGLTSLHL